MKSQSLCVFGLSGFTTWWFSCLLSLLMLVPLYVCERMVAGGTGLTTRRHQLFISWSDVLCIRPWELSQIEPCWNLNLNVENWEHPSHPRFLYVFVLIKSFHLGIPNFDTNPYWSYIERVLKVNSPSFGCGLLLQDALLSWRYFIAGETAKQLR